MSDAYKPDPTWCAQMKRTHHITNVGPEPTLEQRIAAAYYIAVSNVNNVGISTKKQLMWPHSRFSNNDVVSVAARLLASLHSIQLTQLPPAQIQHLSKDLSEYLSFVCEFEQPGGSHHDRDTEHFQALDKQEDQSSAGSCGIRHADNTNEKQA
jgi:hypothetical protein